MALEEGRKALCSRIFVLKLYTHEDECRHGTVRFTQQGIYVPK